MAATRARTGSFARPAALHGRYRPRRPPPGAPGRGPNFRGASGRPEVPDQPVDVAAAALEHRADLDPLGLQKRHALDDDVEELVRSRPVRDHEGDRERRLAAQVHRRTDLEEVLELAGVAHLDLTADEFAELRTVLPGEVGAEGIPEGRELSARRRAGGGAEGRPCDRRYVCIAVEDPLEIPIHRLLGLSGIDDPLDFENDAVDQ